MATEAAIDPVYGLSQRQLPQHPRAEMALLGALLANNRALEKVEAFLRPHHFHDPLHGRLYQAIIERAAAGGVADSVSLVPQFANDPMMIEAGGTGPVFAGLLASMVAIRTAGEYGRAVREAWMRREIIGACAAAIDGAFGGVGESAPSSAVLETLDASLLAIADGAGDEAPLTPIGEAVHDAVAAADAASRRPSGLAGITTGYAALDRMLTGMLPGQMLLLGARPSMGKTALGVGMAVRAAMAGARVYLWSGEMMAAHLGARAAAAYTGLSTSSVFTGRRWDLPDDLDGRPAPLQQSDWERLLAAERAARTLGIEIDTRPGITPQGVRARARRMKRAGGLDLVVLDYVALMRASSGSPRQTLYEKITEISGELVALKQELQVPVLALAQLNRANESRDDKMPQISDLRDSGALEQDADAVLLLHRPHYYLSRNEPQRRANEADDAYHNRCTIHEQQVAAERGRAILNVTKNRNGATGITRLRFHDATTWFRDESEEPDGPAWSGRII